MPISRTEVEAILAKLAAEQRESLDWKNSIVDLMKLLKLDSSLDARKQLAQELGYTGALDGSATMNVWLQKEVMTKLAESGGKVRTVSGREPRRPASSQPIGVSFMDATASTRALTGVVTDLQICRAAFTRILRA